MGNPLKKLTIRGFKSIESLDEFDLQNLNVFIGANGAGKSNFIDFFRMVRKMADEALQSFINDQGGGDGMLFLGPKMTPRLIGKLTFERHVYQFDLLPTPDGMLNLGREQVQHPLTGGVAILSLGQWESSLKGRMDDPSKWPDATQVESHAVYDSISNWTVYHFHDTSPLAPMRRDQPLVDWERFRHDASNIAPFLAKLKEDSNDSYRLIRDTIRLVAPFFDDFLLRPLKRGSDEKLRLEWRQKGSDFPFQPNQLSDGTIRFICLATALLQPKLPATIVIDEPELGLHPYAISVLADLIKSASERTQVIISTQSPTLLDYFEPEQIVVVNRQNGRSTFERLEANALSEWIGDYSVGELWQKNVVRGGPTSE